MTPAARKFHQDVGYNVALGVMWLVCVWLLGGYAVGALGSVTWDRWRPTDATDADWRHRSGLRLYTDHATGCQYISAGGDLTARLNASGHQMCVQSRTPLNAS